MAKQFIQRHNGNLARSTNRFAGEDRDLAAKSATRDMRLRRQRLFDEAMMGCAFEDAEVSLGTACCITDEEPAGDSAEICSQDGGLDIKLHYSPEGRIMAAFCRPSRTFRD